MALRVEIADEQMENMSEKAKEELAAQLRTYAENIIKEANLIEEGNREDGANREITSSHPFFTPLASQGHRNNMLLLIKKLLRRLEAKILVCVRSFLVGICLGTKYLIAQLLSAT